MCLGIGVFSFDPVSQFGFGTLSSWRRDLVNNVFFFILVESNLIPICPICPPKKPLLDLFGNPNSNSMMGLPFMRYSLVIGISSFFIFRILIFA